MAKPKSTTLEEINRESTSQTLAPAVFSTGETPEEFFRRSFIRNLCEQDKQRRANSPRQIMSNSAEAGLILTQSSHCSKPPSYLEIHPLLSVAGQTG